MIKYLLIIALLSLSLGASAADVRCFSEGKQFYHKHIKDLFIGEGFIINRDDSGMEEIVVADCVVRYKVKLRHKH